MRGRIASPGTAHPPSALAARGGAAYLAGRQCCADPASRPQNQQQRYLKKGGLRSLRRRIWPDVKCDPRVKTASVLVDSNVRPRGWQWQADQMNACQPTGTIVPVFVPGKTDLGRRFRQGPPVARTTYNIQKVHHFQQKNRCELGHNLNTISLLSTASINPDGLIVSLKL